MNKSVENFRKALQIKTVSYPETERFNFDEFKKFINFLKETYPLVHDKLEFKIINDYGLLYHWKTDSDHLPIMLLAHYDVVPVNEESWICDPFSATVVNDRIYARGAIDDKNSIISIFETVENLIKNDFKPIKDIYLAFGYDEENLGIRGAKKIAEYLKSENIKFECILDEGGIVTPGSMMGIGDDIAVIGIGEKSQCNYELIFTGEQGHSSAPPEHTAIGKMAAFIKDVEDHPRETMLIKPVEEMLKNLSTKKTGIEKILMRNPKRYFSLIKKSMAKNKQTNALIRTTVAFTMANSGSAPNILPDKASLIANVRVLQGDMPKDIRNWLQSFHHDFELKVIAEEAPTKISNIDTESYRKLTETIKSIFGDVLVTPYLMIGGTDSRNYGELSDNIYKFMPCKLTSDELSLMHADDEYISIDNFNRMITFYDEFIRKVAGNEV